MPQRKKSEPQRRNKPTVVDMRAYGEVAAPPAQKSWLKQTKDWWAAFWSSDLVAATRNDVDFPAVRRLASLIDLRERAYRAVQSEPLVRGSQGQWVENPLAKAMSRYDVEIRQLEDRFGLHPRSRHSLGVQLLAASKTLEDMNRSWQEDHRDSGDDDGAAAVVVEI